METARERAIDCELCEGERLNALNAEDWSAGEKAEIWNDGIGSEKGCYKMNTEEQNEKRGHRSNSVAVSEGTRPDGEDELKEEKEQPREEQEDSLAEHEKMQSREKSLKHRAKGNEYFAQENWKGAVEEYTKALDVCPLVYKVERAALYDRRSECYMKLSLWEEAVDDCTQFLEIDGRCATIRKRRAVCYASLTTSAFEAFEKYRMEAVKKPVETYTKELHKIRIGSTETEDCVMKMVHLKDSMISEDLRKTGNEFYRCGKLEKSLRMYFEALDTAPQGDLTYYLAMKNIATVLMKIGFHKEALKHLRRLLISAEKFSTNKVDGKLFRERIKKCEETPEVKLYVPPEQTLYKGANSICAQLSSAVRIAYNETRERHLVAAERIPEGAVVVKEVPLVMASLNCVTTCKYCSRLLPLSYLPCEDCTARFCDEVCRSKGALIHALDHRYGYGCGLKKVGMCELIAKAIYEFSNQEMEACIAKMPDRRDVSRPFVGSSFAAIMLLKDHPFDDSSGIVHRFVDDICQVMHSKFTDMAPLKCRDFVATVTNELLKRIPKNANCVHRNPQEIFLDSQVASFLVESSAVPFVRETYRSRVVQLLARCPADLRETFVGIALLPIASIANHSCVPNLYHSFSDVGNLCFVVRTTREIRAGEELLCSYGLFAGYHTYQQRKSSLMQRFGFVCECEVCRHHGDHEIDKRIISRMCYRCRGFFTAPRSEDRLCKICNAKFDCMDRGGKDMDDFVDVERVLDTLNWQNCHQETLTVLFDRALNVYPYGNQTLADFAVMAFLAAFRDGNVDAACKYMRHIIDMREAGFGDRANHLLASAHFAFAIFLYIRMRSASSSCKVEQFQSVKRHAYEARQLFRILYGEGSVRDFELDFMLSEARRAVAQ